MQRQLFQQRIRRQHRARKGILHRQQRLRVQTDGIEWLGFYPLFHAAALCQTQGANAAGAPYNLLWVPIFLVVVAAALAWAIGNDLTEAYEWAGVDLDAL